jgi:hypothetical protein
MKLKLEMGQGKELEAPGQLELRPSALRIHHRNIWESRGGEGDSERLSIYRRNFHAVSSLEPTGSGG